MSPNWQRAKELSRASVFSPLGMVLWAARLSGVLLVLHLLGGRACTTVLSGTVHQPAQMFLGITYVISYFACAAFTPPLLIGALLAAALNRIRAALETRPSAAALQTRQGTHVC